MQFCGVCGDSAKDCDTLFACSKCSVTVHNFCRLNTGQNKGDSWVCSTCSSSECSDCCFCQSKNALLYKVQPYADLSMWCHVCCMFGSLSSRATAVCVWCDNSDFQLIYDEHRRCYHVSCALESGLLLDWVPTGDTAQSHHLEKAQTPHPSVPCIGERGFKLTMRGRNEGEALLRLKHFRSKKLGNDYGDEESGRSAKPITNNGGGRGPPGSAVASLDKSGASPFNGHSRSHSIRSSSSNSNTIGQSDGMGNSDVATGPSASLTSLFLPGGTPSFVDKQLVTASCNEVTSFSAPKLSPTDTYSSMNISTQEKSLQDLFIEPAPFTARVPIPSPHGYASLTPSFSAATRKNIDRTTAVVTSDEKVEMSLKRDLTEDFSISREQMKRRCNALILSREKSSGSPPVRTSGNVSVPSTSDARATRSRQLSLRLGDDDISDLKCHVEITGGVENNFLTSLPDTLRFEGSLSLEGFAGRREVLLMALAQSRSESQQAQLRCDDSDCAALLHTILGQSSCSALLAPGTTAAFDFLLTRSTGTLALALSTQGTLDHTQLAYDGFLLLSIATHVDSGARCSNDDTQFPLATISPLTARIKKRARPSSPPPRALRGVDANFATAEALEASSDLSLHFPKTSWPTRLRMLSLEHSLRECLRDSAYI